MSGQKSSPNNDLTPINLVLLGRIGAAQGLKGEVRISSYTEEPLAIGRYGELFTSKPELTLHITNLRIAKPGKKPSPQTVIIARLKGIDTRTKAEDLNGIELFIEKKKLQQNQPDQDQDKFLHIDLIGLEARLKNGTTIGEVIALPNYGAADLLEIREISGKTVLLPFTHAVVPDIQISQGFLTIVPPEEISGEQKNGGGNNEF